MQPLSKMSKSELGRRLALLEKEIATVTPPSLWQEYKIVVELLANYDTTEQPYLKLKWGEAIPLCLSLHRAWMAKDQIQQALEVGGFVIRDPAAFPYTLGDVLRYYWEKGEVCIKDSAGKLLKQGTKLPRLGLKNAVYGLPDWAKDASIGTMK